ncbi:immunoglobulin domain protein [Dictyocaulus viviparus]|uniref:Immunoglobulin domain protein n=1 Tax=Dictyocaulus viviparus TaxID=29172 RepID=A0A0D8X7Q7_DICVI|nr:immunoglobulin domain protein [Dictyocaulus viviparus]
MWWIQDIIAIVTVEDYGRAWDIVVTPYGDRLLDQKTGGNFIVSCKVKDYDGAASDVKIDWYKNGKLASRIGNMMTINKTYGVQLLINSPKISDGGVYVCKAEVNGMEQEKTVVISFADPPKFISPKVQQNPEEGSNAEIVCRVQGTDKLEIFWQFNGSILEEGSPRGYEFEDDRQILIIPNYNSKKDDGIYNCNAAQFSSFETLAINVTGYSRPMITVFDIPLDGVVFEGSSAKLQCGAVGKPKPIYEWFDMNDNIIVDSDKYKVQDGLLIIESLSEHDAGEYKCVSSNSVGNASRVAELKMILKPRIEKLSNLTRREKQDAEITCRYSGDNIVAAKFIFGSEEYSAVEDVTNGVNLMIPIDSNEHHKADRIGSDANTDNDDNEEKEESFEEDVTSERISVRTDGNNLILRIRNLTQMDAGAYKCAVLNRAGWAERLFHITVTHSPVLRRASNDIIRSFDGNTVQIFCEVSAVPDPVWTWFKDGSELEINDLSIMIENTGAATKLILQGTNEKSYGKYTCRADNGIGTFTKSIEVIRIVVPDAPQGILCNMRLYPNYVECIIDSSMYYDKASRPTRIEMQILENNNQIMNDVDWSNAHIVSVPFEGNQMMVQNLTPSTQYLARVRAVNEAGGSDYGQPFRIETTGPWAPQKPSGLRMKCNEVCTVYWEEPNNHGSDIIAYRVGIQQFIENEYREKQTVSNELVMEVDGGEKSLQLLSMRPHSSYRISVAAINAIGVGEREEIEVDTNDLPLVASDLLIVPKLPIIVGITLFILLVVIDLICYVANRCGLIACFCINCLGQTPRDHKEDVEATRVENSKLLDSQTARQ